MEQSGQDESDFEARGDDSIDLRDPRLTFEIDIENQVVEPGENEIAESLNTFMSLGLSIRAAQGSYIMGQETSYIFDVPSQEIYNGFLDKLHEIGLERLQFVDREPDILDYMYEAILSKLDLTYDAQFCNKLSEVLMLRKKILGPEPRSHLVQEQKASLSTFDTAVRHICEKSALELIQPYVEQEKMPPIPPFSAPLLYGLCQVSSWDRNKESDDPELVLPTEKQLIWMERVQLTIQKHELMSRDALHFLPV
jgi:hypothetical protein